MESATTELENLGLFASKAGRNPPEFAAVVESEKAKKKRVITGLFCSRESPLPLEIQWIILSTAGIANVSRKGCYFWIHAPIPRSLKYHYI